MDVCMSSLSPSYFITSKWSTLQLIDLTKNVQQGIELVPKLTRGEFWKSLACKLLDFAHNHTFYLTHTCTRTEHTNTLSLRALWLRMHAGRAGPTGLYFIEDWWWPFTHCCAKHRSWPRQVCLDTVSQPLNFKAGLLPVLEGVCVFCRCVCVTNLPEPLDDRVVGAVAIFVDGVLSPIVDVHIT